MTEYLPDPPRYIQQTPQGFWIGANHQNGPWRSIPAPQQALPWPTDGPAMPENREPASVAPDAIGPRPLSPAAQGIAQAFNDRYELCGPFDDNWQELCIAAALRAVADQVVPEPPDCGPASHDYNKGAEDRQKIVRFRLLALAAELEGLNG